MIPFSVILWFSTCLISILNFIMMSWVFLIIKSRKEKNQKTSKYPKISVLIPAYNEEKNIAKCLKSVISSNYPKNKLEIIVVDDGSKDDTYKIASKFKRVKVFKIRHRGKWNAIKFGLKKCHGKFTLILDADTVIDKNAIKMMLKKMKKDVGAATIVPKIANNKNMLTTFQQIEYMLNSITRKGMNALSLGNMYVWGCGTIYRTKLLKRMRFKKSLTEDFYLTVEIQKLGYKVVISEKSFGYTRVPENLRDFVRQRIRWALGPIPVIKNNLKLLFNKKYKSLGYYSLPLQIFWYPYITLITPLIFIQIFHWIPYQNSIFKLSWYFFTWFSLAGPLYSIYMIPTWGFSIHTIVGILPAFFSTFLILYSLKKFREKIGIKQIFAIFFFFPYCLLINFCFIAAIFLFFIKRFSFW